MNKHIVNAVASYLGLETFCGFLRGQCFIFGALCPSKSGLVNKHVVKHIVKHRLSAFLLDSSSVAAFVCLFVCLFVGWVVG